MILYGFSLLLLLLLTGPVCLLGQLVIPEGPGALVLQFAGGGSNDTSTQCRRLYAVDGTVPVAEAGIFCLVIDLTSTTTLGASYSTTSPWQLREIRAWFNTDATAFETDRESSAPKVDKFPYKSNKDDLREGESTFDFTIDLAEAGFDCTTAGTIGQQMFGMAYAQMDNDGDNGNGALDGWADGVVNENIEGQEARLWTIFNYTLTCIDPASLTPAPTSAPITANPTVLLTPSPTPFRLQDGVPCSNGADCASTVCGPQGFCLISTGAACTSGQDLACAANACINGVCGNCGDPAVTAANPTIDQGLTYDVVTRSNTAALLIDYLQAGLPTGATPPVTMTEMGLYNKDPNNQAMVAKVDGVCYAVFAPIETERELFTFGTIPVTAFQQTCQVHERAFNAYFTADRQFLELRLAQCAGTCLTEPTQALPVVEEVSSRQVDIANDIVATPNAQAGGGGCPIVLAGHGLGGGAAMIASLAMLDLNPTVLTMGAPRTVSPLCPLISETAAQRYTRFVNLALIPSVDTSLFDAIPQLNIHTDGGAIEAPIGTPALAHYGTPVLLDDTQAIVLELNNDATRASIYNFNSTLDVMTPSQLSLYTSRLQVMAAASCFPIPATNTWANGHWCDQDDLCDSGRCRAFIDLGTDFTATNGICSAKGLDGTVCGDAGDCLSTVCNAGSCLGDVPPAVINPGTTTPSVGTITPTTNTLPTLGPTPGATSGGGTGTGGSCSICTAGTDCQSGICTTFANVPGVGDTSVCAENSQGTMSTGCFCNPNDDAGCTQGRCEEDISGTLWLCITPLAECEPCNEASDCFSKNCDNGICGLESGGPANCADDGNSEIVPLTRHLRSN
jgi:hypothetical protein